MRNALSRFGQVRFETDEARGHARRKLLNAAKRHGIVPVGFIEGELRTAKAKSSAGKLVIELGRIDSSAELQLELRRTLKDPHRDNRPLVEGRRHTTSTPMGKHCTANSRRPHDRDPFCKDTGGR